MTSKLTRERLQEIAEDGFLKHGESKVLARMALAAMGSEPVAWIWQYREQWHVTSDPRRAEFVAKDGDVEVFPLYRHAQTAPKRDQVRNEHAEWSQATFGNVGPVGPLKHLSKEALEAAAEPGDLSEWADMQFLLWDAQRRAGITDEQITQAMIEKLAVNKQREWPEPKDGEPRLHIKEQPAPVVPEEKPMPNPLSMYAVDAVAAIAEVKGWNACRAAMLQAGNSPVIGIDLASGPDRSVEVRYVAPPGYVMVPKEPTEAMMLHNSGCQHHAWDDPDCAMRQTRRLIWSHMLAAATQPQNAPQNIPEIIPGWIPVSERMPDETQPVIVVSEGGVVQRTVYQFCEGVWSDWYDLYDDVNIEAFTHWMPLPAGPKEVKGD